MSRVVVAVPPLRVADRFIDNPAFAFLPPLLWAAAAAKQHEVHVENALLSGAPLLRTPEGWLLGGEPKAFWSRIAKLKYDELVIAWSSFHRRTDPAGDTLPEANHLLFTGRPRVHLVEFWHAESRFEPNRPSLDALAHLPFATKRFEPSSTIDDRLLGVSAKAGEVPLHAAWVDEASRRSMANVDPILRTGAADGARESHPAGSEWRSQGRIWPLLTSTGCSYRCLFCHKPGSAGTWRARPLEVVQRELEILADAGVRLVFVLDPIANYEAAHFGAVLDSLASHGMSAVFPNGLAPRHLTPELLTRLRAVTSDLVVSLESGSARSLETLRKPIDLDHAERILTEAKRLGFNLSAHFIIGIPGESEGDVASTLHLASRLHDELGVTPSIQRYVAPGMTDGGILDSGAGDAEEPPQEPHATRRIAPNPVPLETAAMWVREYTRGKATPKVIINLTYACNNHCSFCAVADRPRVHGLLDEQLRLLREARKQGVLLVDFDGGEPTLYAPLPKLIQAANELGYERINVTTNGRRLCYRDFADKLAQFRNLELSVSLHGPDAATHEALTRVPGSFHQTLTGLWNAVRAGLDVALNITAVAGNTDRLFDTVRLGVENGVKKVAIQRYTPFGTPDIAFEPPLDVLLEQVRKIREQLPALKLKLVNFCACEAGPFAELAAGDQAKAVRTMQFVDLRETPLATWLSVRRRHVDVCERCHLRQVCPGKWVHDDAAATTDELIDFTPGLSCSMQCRFCAVPAGASSGDLDTEAALQMLSRLSPRRPAVLRISGGEPTERDDLPELIQHARTLGYPRIGIQTHGLGLEDSLDRLVSSGLNEVRFSLFGASDEDYGSATGVNDGFSKLLKAVEHATARLGDGVGLDVLALRPMLPRLAETVGRFSEMGVKDVLVWLPAYEGRAAVARGSDLVPTLREASVPFQQALALSNPDSGTRVRSIYAPLCILGPYRAQSYDVRRANVLIVNPSMILPMSQCAVDLGMFPPRCEPCTLRESCLGLRPSYYERMGDGEVEPITAQEASCNGGHRVDR